MNLVIILLVIVIIILLIWLYKLGNTKNDKFEITEKIIDKNNEMKEGITKNLYDNKKEIIDEMYTFRENVNKNIDNNLKEGFKKSNETFTSVVERLSKIDEAQKNINKLSEQILDLQRVLTDKKLRGNFGEIQLSQILYNVFGQEGNLYKLQYTMENDNKKVDAVILYKDPIGILPIDSKFPLENFNRIQNGEDVRKEFVSDVKKHISDISYKYVKLQALNQAIMFIPSEAIYIYILANCPEIVDYSYKNKVWIASPTTLLAILTTIQLSIVNIEKNENAEKLYKDLKELEPEFRRYKERWANLTKDIEKIAKDIKDVSITSEKIGGKFERINNAQ